MRSPGWIGVAALLGGCGSSHIGQSSDAGSPPDVAAGRDLGSADAADGGQDVGRDVAPRSSAREACVVNHVVMSGGTPFVDYTITVHDPTASGDVAPERRFGWLTEMHAPYAIAVDDAHHEIFVANADPISSITVYPANANGDLPPIRTLRGPTTTLGIPWALAIDPTNDELVVFDGGTGMVLFFPHDATGDVAPLRSFTPLTGAVGIALDVVHGELVQTNQTEVTFYPLTSTGRSVSPTRTLSGSATGLASASGVAIDQSHDEIFVVNSDQQEVRVFDRTAAGDQAPKRILSGDTTGLINPWPIAYDPAHDELVIGGYLIPVVTTYARTATGGAVPLRTLSGSQTLLEGIRGVAVDATGRIYALDNIVPKVTSYDRAATGDAAPSTVLSGAVSGLAEPLAITSSPSSDEIFVAEHVPGLPGASIVAYDRLADGPGTRPLRTIAGTTTLLDSPSALAYDPGQDELFVAEPGANAISVFDRTANGDVAPKRTIVGNATGLHAPSALAIDTANGELWIGNDNDVSSTVTVFSLSATGNAAPLRTFTSGDLYNPRALAVDAAHDEVFAGANGVYVFARSATGNVASLRSLTGSSAGTVGVVGLYVDGQEIIVASSANAALAIHDRMDSGSAAPLRRIAGNASRLAPVGLTRCR